MNDFKVGDRVEVIAAESTGGHYKNGDVFTIAKVDDDDGDMDMAEMTGMFLHPREVRLHTPAPDVITIDRADLPEVEVNEAGWVKSANNYLAHVDSADPTTLRRIALQYLSAAEFLEAREKDKQETAAAEKEAADKLQRRRDVMAREMYLEAFGKDDGINYRNRNYLTQLCIDRIIELEDAAN